MQELIIIDMLMQDSVSVKKQNITTVNGINYPIGELRAKSYINSVRGRQELQAEVTEPYLSSILGVWGDKPTVMEETL